MQFELIRNETSKISVKTNTQQFLSNYQIKKEKEKKKKKRKETILTFKFRASALMIFVSKMKSFSGSWSSSL